MHNIIRKMFIFWNFLKIFNFFFYKCQQYIFAPLKYLKMYKKFLICYPFVNYKLLKVST